VTDPRRAGADQNAKRSVLVLDASSTKWRRKLGPLRWAVVEELAVGAELDEEGWAARIGSRGVGERLGVTKETAARALSALAAVGLVERTTLRVGSGHTRSGYRLYLPEELVLRLGERCHRGDCPTDTYSAPDNADVSRFIVDRDRGRDGPGAAEAQSGGDGHCIDFQDTADTAASELGDAATRPSTSKVSSTAAGRTQTESGGDADGRRERRESSPRNQRNPRGTRRPQDPSQGELFDIDWESPASSNSRETSRNRASSTRAAS
jgi:hypothetical protein